MVQKLDLWITCGSTYTYLTMHRLGELEQLHDVQFRLRPFYLGKIFDDLGRWPFPDGAEKTQYMWRDIERRASQRGLAVNLPAPYPAPQTVRANQVATYGLKEGWGRAFIQAAYQNWFEHGLLPGEMDNLTASLATVNQDVANVLRGVSDTDIHGYLCEETDQAQALGVFGAPTCVVGSELFWGDDRLEDAISWAKSTL